MSTRAGSAHPPASPWPARLDLLQSLSGLALALFLWAHLFFESSILLGREAMRAVALMFEGYYFFGRSYPAIVSVLALGVLALVAVHAVLALRKFPHDWREYRSIRAHSERMHHDDTALWLWQVYTGFALFFLVPAHLYVMISNPAGIGPEASSQRVWEGMYWPLYVLLLLAGVVHANVGLYRLALKWGWPRGADPDEVRLRLKRARLALTAVFLLLGFTSLGAYMKLGAELAQLAPAGHGVVK